MAKSNNFDNGIWNQSLRFYDLVVNTNGDVDFGELDYLDSMKPQDKGKFEGSFLAPLVHMADNEVSVQDAIGDLKIYEPNDASNYVVQLNETFDFLHQHTTRLNHDLRNNSPVVIQESCLKTFGKY